MVKTPNFLTISSSVLAVALCAPSAIANEHPSANLSNQSTDTIQSSSLLEPLANSNPDPLPLVTTPLASPQSSALPVGQKSETLTPKELELASDTPILSNAPIHPVLTEQPVPTTSEFAAPTTEEFALTPSDLPVDPILSDPVIDTLESADSQPTASALQEPPLVPLDITTHTIIAQEEPSAEADTLTDEPNAKRKRSGWAIVPKVGTLGLGADLVRKITPNLNARVGFSRFGIGVDVESDDIEYDADLTVGGIPLFLDWFPFKKIFRVTGGLVINQNDIDVDANTTDQGATVDIGGQTFTSADVGTIEGEADFNDVVPYLGIGIGNPVRPGKRWGFSLDIGVMFQGSPEVRLRAPNANPAIAPQLQTALDTEAGNVQNDVDGIDVYPVIQLGVTYQF